MEARPDDHILRESTAENALKIICCKFRDFVQLVLPSDLVDPLQLGEIVLDHADDSPGEHRPKESHQKTH